MGKLNEVQKQKTQSFGDNAFTTTIKDNTVEFDSVKDSFTFTDEVNVPSLKINGNVVNPNPQVDVSYTNYINGFALNIGKLTVGEQSYYIKRPTVQYAVKSGTIITLEADVFAIYSEGSQTSISITVGGVTNAVNVMYAIFTAGANFTMPDSGYSNVQSLTEGKKYMLTVIGDSIKGWNYHFEEIFDLSI